MLRSGRGTISFTALTTFATRVRGFTIVELGLVLTIVGVLFALGMPNALLWIRNSQIRAAADSLTAGLSLARAEALRRNAAVEFVLTNDDIQQATSSTITPSVSGRNWLIRLYRNDGANTPADFIQARAGAETSASVQLASNTARIVFNSLGDYSLTEPANVVPLLSLVPKDGSCEAVGGQFRCLEVDVKPGGMVKMCDPRVDPADPRTCAAAV